MNIIAKKTTLVAMMGEAQHLALWVEEYMHSLQSATQHAVLHGGEAVE